jgi:hypothetical protein
MNFKFEFFNIHISHLAQLGMINITLKCQKKKTYVKMFTIFNTIQHGFWLLCVNLHPFKIHICIREAFDKTMT